METVKAPGLKWRKLAGGYSPIWVADEADVKAGYQPKTVNLRHLVDTPEILVARCNSLQADMILWRTGHRFDPLVFDGSIESLFRVYETHKRSPYRDLKPGSLRPYKHYLRRMKGHIGKVLVDDITGIRLMDWHDLWSESGKHLAAAAVSRSILGAALSFGVMLRFAGCVEAIEVLRETNKKLPKPRSRDETITADDVIRLRKVAHDAGRPAMALAYALAFETTLRLWDVIGQWWPMDMGGISDVINADRREKWFGLRWEDIDAEMVLRYKPSKTEMTTGKAVAYPLSKAPMVLEELAHWPETERIGPMINSPFTGLPYRSIRFQEQFRADRKKAGVLDTVWARDLRASGITEGRATDVSLDDAGKVAGHSSKTTTKIYDRAVLEAADRFADARVKARKQSGNTSGNAR